MKKIIFAAIAAVILSSGVLYGATATMFADSEKAESAEKGTPFSFTVSDFDEIDVSGIIKVDYTVGPVGTVTVEPGENTDPDLFRYSVKNGKLKMWMEDQRGVKNVNSNDYGFTVTMSGPALRSVDVGGMSSIKFFGNYNISKVKVEAGGMSKVTFGTLNTADADLDASGMSNITVSASKVGTLDVEASGMSKIAVSGTADSADLEASGMSSIDCRKLKCSEISSDSSGMSSIKK